MLPNCPFNECRTGCQSPIAVEPENASRSRKVPQFTLKGLFAFFTGLTVSISLAVSSLRLDLSESVTLLLLAGFVLWVILSVTYDKLDRQKLRTLHEIIPVITGCFAMVCVAGTLPRVFEAGSRLDSFFVWVPVIITLGALAGCGIASLVTLPLFVVAMAGAMLESASDDQSTATTDRKSHNVPQRVQEPFDHRVGVGGEDGQSHRAFGAET